MNTAITAVSSKRTMKSDIPINFIADILSRLPVKSVVRFFCFSKPWAELIEEPGFINTHLKRSINSDRDCTIIIDQKPNVRSLLFRYDNENCLPKAMEIYPPLQGRRRKRVATIVDYCNGEESSWIQVYKIDLRANTITSNLNVYLKPLKFSRDGKKVVLDDCKNLFWYDIEKKRSKRLESQNLPVVFTPLTSTGSLLLLDGDSVIDPKEKKRKK